MISRWAYRTGVSKERLQDLAIWVFIFGIIGARIVFMIQYKVPPENFFKIWEGGIVFYGSAIGGWVGYLLGRWWYRKETISTWKIADMIAPLVCIGLAIGRIGCFLNGCCFGHVCTAENTFCARFPTLTSPARELVVTGTVQDDGTIRNGGYQTFAGFALDERLSEPVTNEKPPAIVGPVEPGSPAASAGLQPGDRIEAVNGQAIENVYQLERMLLDNWPRGVPSMELTVRRNGEASPITMKFTPRTLPLYPTQLFESISMILLFFLLTAFFPYRQYYGQVFVLLMIGYAFHRFFNETLRDDTDPVLALKQYGINLTLSQVGSILVLTSAIVLHFFLRKFSRIEAASAPLVPTPAPVPAAATP
jgi:prolipoprotein diacylglyceryltransferase